MEQVEKGRNGESNEDVRQARIQVVWSWRNTGVKRGELERGKYTVGVAGQKGGWEQPCRMDGKGAEEGWGLWPQPLLTPPHPQIFS